MLDRAILSLSIYLLLAGGATASGALAEDSGNSPAGAASSLPKNLMLRAQSGDRAAQFHLGRIYEAGEGVTQDGREAIKWYQKAADQGSAAAALKLGEAYDSGRLVVLDQTEAVKWYKRAAQAGNARAAYELGRHYSSGLGVRQEQIESAKWYKQAASKGNPLAQYELGNKYRTGEGVPQDYPQAIKCYKQAARKHNAPAQLQLAQMYKEGDGAPRDLQLAYIYFSLASASDDPSAGDARRKADEIGPQLSELELHDAQSITSNYYNEGRKETRAKRRQNRPSGE